MILRRADCLTTDDTVRLEDDRLWNVENVTVGERVTVRLSRMAGGQMVLDLLPDDLIRLAY